MPSEYQKEVGNKVRNALRNLNDAIKEAAEAQVCVTLNTTEYQYVHRYFPVPMLTAKVEVREPVFPEGAMHERTTARSTSGRPDGN